MSTVRNYWAEPSADHDAKLTPADIVEMQTIDADCNDCRHFKRGKLVKQIQGLTGLLNLGKSGHYFEGHCLKLDKQTRARPVHYAGHECFEHRKMQISA